MTSSTTPNAEKTGIVRRIFAFPLVWFVLGAAAIVTFDQVLKVAVYDLGTPIRLAVALVSAAVAIGLYVLTMRLLARRSTPELRGSIAREFVFGAAIGAFFVVASVLIIAGRVRG